MRLSWLCCLLIVGCGGPSVSEVTGVALVDGKPLGGVCLQFWHLDTPDFVYAAVLTDTEGHFDVVRPDTAKKWPEGKYKVTVLDQSAMAAALSKESPRVPLAYMNRRTTPLVVELQPGCNPNMTLDLPGPEHTVAP